MRRTGLTIGGLALAMVLVSLWMRRDVGPDELPPIPGLQPPIPSLFTDSPPVFPAVRVWDDQDRERSTDALVASGVSVVLFLAVDCPPCKRVTRRWRRSRDQLEDARLLAIVSGSDEEIGRTREAAGFPVYHDREHRFATYFGVDSSPWEAVVQDGRIVRFTGDPGDMGRPALIGVR